MRPPRARRAFARDRPSCSSRASIGTRASTSGRSRRRSCGRRSPASTPPVSPATRWPGVPSDEPRRSLASVSTSRCAPRGHRRRAGNLLRRLARARERRRLGKPGRARGACLRHARVAAHLVASLREGGHIADRARPPRRSACGHRADVRVVEARRARPALRGPRPERPARPDLRAARRPGRRRRRRRGDRRDSVAAFRPARGARRRRPGLRRADRRSPALPRVQPRAALRGGDLGRVPRAARAQLPAAGAPLPAKARRARCRVVPPRRGSRSVAARSGHALPASSRTVGRRRRRPSCRRPRSIGNSRSWRCGKGGCDCGSSRSTGGPSPRSTASGSPAPSRRTRPGATRPSATSRSAFVLLAHAVREALADGMHEYRLLRGGAAYKERFATSDPGLETYGLPRGASAQAILRAALAARGRSLGLRRVLDRL